MSEPVRADEIKEAIRPLREVLARLGDDKHAEKARDAMDTVRDEALKSVEATPVVQPMAYSGH